MADEYVERFGEHIRSLRKARGLNQIQFAEAAGLSPDTIRRIEQGGIAPSITTLRKLCLGLQISMTTLFGGFELGEEPSNEIGDLLRARSREDASIGLSILRSVFEALDDARRRHG